MFKFFHVSIAVANIGSLKYYLFYLKLVKFEQNWMIQTTQNLDLFDKKLFTMLTIFDILAVGAILKEISVSKTIKWC